MNRQAFEAFITAPPFEMGISRFDDRGAWPGSYRSYDVDLAWQAYKAATNAALERAAKACQNVARKQGTIARQLAAMECGEVVRTLKDEK